MGEQEFWEQTNRDRCAVCDTRLSAVHGDCHWCALQAYARVQFWQVHLDTLASNLAIAAALCRADANGCRRGMHTGLLSGPNTWRPGCRKAAP